PTVRFLAPRNAFPLPSSEPMVTLPGRWRLMSRLPAAPVPLLRTFTLAVPPREPLENRIEPPPAPLAVPPLAINVALPAVEVLKNCVRPPTPPKTVAPLLVKEVMLPAVALLLNNISPLLPAPSTAVTKFCVIPELLVMPVPLRVNVTVGLTVIVKECVSKAV